MTQLNESKRSYQKIGLKLRQMIDSMNYVIGDRLPTERELAEILSVSRSAVREALIMLEIENIIEVRKGSGIFLVSPSSQKEHIVSAPSIGPFELLQAQQLLQSNIAEFAAAQATPLDIYNIRSAQERVRNGLITGVCGTQEFHLAIAQATHNNILIELFKTSWAQRENHSIWVKLFIRIASSKEYSNGWINDHHSILAGMIKKRPDAAKSAMWLHLENVKQHLLELSDVDDLNFDGYLFSSYPAFLACS
ncbi:GntR family transcriptional regulator [Klebsiella aerogenes]|uniref:GntR family transcriptional regulator n=1 Tax=Klebsiella aerogenes TaxID=548 RepID=UPI0009BA3B00|nr:GntR family transcriptional regulator [Klebsiella aerogenes]ELI7202094.1 GntR family transcriptional regulator [Klebsiella aerogenes]